MMHVDKKISITSIITVEKYVDLPDDGRSSQAIMRVDDNMDS